MFNLAGGGAERTVINIINNLDSKKFEVKLLIGTKNNNDYINQISSEVDVKYLNKKRLRNCFFKLRRFIKNERPDIVFTTGINNNIMLSLVNLTLLKKSRLVVRETTYRTKSTNISLLKKILTYLTYNMIADKVISLSRGVKEDLVNNFHINKEKIVVIYNPVEINKINQLKSEKINYQIREKDEKLILSVGRLVEQKDFPTLIKAFSLVQQKMKAKLIILGKGHLINELKSLSEQLGIKDKVLFLGFKQNPYKYMRYSDVFVLTSKVEGFGHVIVEAMTTGTPIISTNCVSGPREIIGDNKYGILVPVGDYKTLALKILELLKDEKLQKNLRLLGHKRARDFDSKKIIKQYEALFLNLIE